MSEYQIPFLQDKRARQAGFFEYNPSYLFYDDLQQ